MNLYFGAYGNRQHNLYGPVWSKDWLSSSPWQENDESIPYFWYTHFNEDKGYVKRFYFGPIAFVFTHVKLDKNGEK